MASSSAKENAPKRLRAAAALPDRVMREQISRVTPTLQKCYEAALKRSPDLTAVIEARLWIDARGAVARVKLGGVAQNPELRRCLEEAFVGLAFPAPDGGPVELVVPLRLYPDM